MTIYILGLIILFLLASLYYIRNEVELQNTYIIDLRFLAIVLIAILLWPFTVVYLLADYGIEKYMDWKDK